MPSQETSPTSPKVEEEGIELRAQNNLDTVLLEPAGTPSTDSYDSMQGSEHKPRPFHDDPGERPTTVRRLEDTERSASCVRPKDPEGLQRPHAFQHMADDGTETYFTTAMLVRGTSPDKDFEIEVYVVEKKEPNALQDPELHQWMLDEHPEDD